MSSRAFRARAWPCIRDGIATLAALAMSAVAVPSHAGGLSIGWQDCRAEGATGTDQLSFGCGSSLVEFPLFPALSLAAPVDSVIAMELVVDVDVAADVLPLWWRMDPGQCRAGGWRADVVAVSSCTDPWLDEGVASTQGWFPGQPGGAARHGRLLVAVAATPGNMASLAADTPYSLCRILLRTNNTLTCEGCTTPACLVFNSVLIRRLPGSSPEELTFSDPEAPGLTQVRWQGGSGADCQAVPVIRRTWGAVKSLYR